ncbi:hypothetical protein PTKIN_Ptkin15bG0140500 [Pterospermum kingtungense]
MGFSGMKGWLLCCALMSMVVVNQMQVDAVFWYPVGVHNVFRVNGTDFKSCMVPPGTLTTGNDTITLVTPGRKWYLCDVGKHCENGQKLFINVQPAGEVAPALALPAYYSSKGAKDTVYYQLSSMLMFALVTLIVA